MADVDRGAHLFVAKGCVGCHVNGNVDRRTLVTIGPELTDRRYPPVYLTKLLADPASVQGVRQGPRMPNLALREPEIRALVAFINAEPAPAPR
jgi:cytochrome c1